jgi:hypothetical protein
MEVEESSEGMQVWLLLQTREDAIDLPRHLDPGEILVGVLLDRSFSNAQACREGVQSTDAA